MSKQTYKVFGTGKSASSSTYHVPHPKFLNQKPITKVARGKPEDKSEQKPILKYGVGSKSSTNLLSVGLGPGLLRNTNKEIEKVKKMDNLVKIPENHILLSENLRVETLRTLKKTFDKLVDDLNTCPIENTSNVDLISKLEKLEETVSILKVYAQPTVFVQKFN